MAMTFAGGSSPFRAGRSGSAAGCPQTVVSVFGPAGVDRYLRPAVIPTLTPDLGAALDFIAAFEAIETAHGTLRLRIQLRVGAHFFHQTRGHVEYEATHGHVFIDPGMRSDFPDLFPGVLLGVFESEEAHGRGG
jgi:hypothetical protein